MTANALTASRLILAGIFSAGVALVSGPQPAALGALAMLAVLAVAEELTDMLDGMVARGTGTATQLGGILDPLADSLARLAMYFAMALAGWVPLAVPLVMAGRDVIVAYTRIINALTGGKTSARMSGKFKALVQCGGIFAVLVLAALEGRAGQELLTASRWVVAAAVIVATLWSLCDYVRGAWPGVRQMAQPAVQKGAAAATATAAPEGERQSQVLIQGPEAKRQSAG